MAAKLGLQSHDQALTTELLTLMAQSEADWTNTFRALAHIPTADTAASNGSSSSSAANNNGSSSSSSVAESADAAQEEQQPLASAAAAVGAALAAGLPQRLVDALSAEQLQQQPQLIESWAAWLRVWKGRLSEEGLSDEQRMAMQMAASPKFVPRQHLLQVRGSRDVNGSVVWSASCRDAQVLMLGCRLLAAWLAEEGVPDEQRMAMQRAASPKFVPRQHLLQVRDLQNCEWFCGVVRSVSLFSRFGAAGPFLPCCVAACGWGAR
jgi:uncharacterized protein YdiU (UPF0061 family)